MELQAHRYNTYLSSQGGSIGTSFSGTLDFVYTSSSTTAISDLSKSYFALSATLDPTNHLDLTNTENDAAHNQGFVQNAEAQLFSMFQFYVNDKLVANIDNFKTHSTAKKLLNESYEDQKSSTSPLYLSEDNLTSKITLVPANFNADPTTVTINDYFKHMRVAERDYYTRLANSQIIKNVTGTYPTESPVLPTLTTLNKPYFVEFIIPFPAFEIIEGSRNIPPNVKLGVQFQVSPTLYQDLFVGINANNNLTNSQFNVNHFAWVIPEYVAPIPQSLKCRYDYYENKTFRKLHNSNLYQFSVPSNAERITIYFSNTSKSVDGGIQTCVPVNPTLTSFGINYIGRNFPSSMYRLTKSEVGNDWSKAYAQYLRFSNTYKTGEIPVIDSLAKFYKHPVFTFYTRGSENSVNVTPLTINVISDPTITDTDINVLVESVNSLHLEYDENGICRTTEVGSVG